jgi:Golgi phosphoprotein 3
VGYIDNLFLYEEIMLLALKDEEGTIASGSLYNYAVGGAIIAELLLSQRIALDQSKRKKLVSVINSELFNDSLIDEWLIKMSSAKRRKTFQDWVTRIADTKALKHRIAMQLCQRGILRMDKEKILLLFTRRIYPEINPNPEQEIIDRLRNAIFTDTDDVAARTVVLLSLAKSANILPVVFGKKEIKQRKKRIEQIVNGEISGKVTKEAIDAMQTAVMVACIMPAIIIAATSASTH